MANQPAKEVYEHDAEKRGSDSDQEIHHDKLHPFDTATSAPVEWTFKRVVAFVALCLAYVGAQGILYFTGGCLSYIEADLKTTVPNWLLTANTLAVTAVCPFVGYITDLLGRRYVCIFGALLLVIASAVLGTAHSFAAAIVAETLGGIGAGICELTALAGVAEITPVKWRGVSLAIVTFSIIPFIPYLIYIVELEAHSTWRWSFMIVGGWNLLGLLGILFCYNPPPRHNVDGLSRSEILKRIDWIGGVISISGVTLFLVGLQAGGYQFPWTSGKVLAPLIIGIILLAIFPIWEWKGAKYPMVPPEIFKGQRVVAIAYVAVFVAGMNFYSILGFFPLMLTNMYTASPITTGLRGLGYPLAILFGACIVNSLISYTKGHVREMFFISAAIMTAFGGAIAAATPFNPGYAVAVATIDSFGIGAIIVPALTVALYACPDRYIGTTAALSLSVRFLGGSVGTAIYYNIFNTKFSTKFPAYVAKAVVPLGFPEKNLVQLLTALSAPVGAAAAAEKVPGITLESLEAAALAAQWALADSLKYVWLTTIAFGVCSMVAVLFLPNLRQYMSHRVAVDIH